jgi:probable HAF family extracellular repeat protein
MHLPRNVEPARSAVSRAVVFPLFLSLLSGIAPIASTADCFGQTAAPRYKITDLGPSLVRTLVDTPGMNQRGDAAFWRTSDGSTTHAIFLKGEKSIEIGGSPDFPIVYPADLSNDDTIIGLMQSAQDMRFTRAFRWRDGKLQVLAPLGGAVNDATAINSLGDIVGEAQLANGVMHAVLWRGAAPLDLGTLGSGDFSKARDINNRGDIVGEANIAPKGKPRAFAWEKGKMRQLALLEGGTLCSAQAVNDHGEIVGSCDNDDGDYHATLWRNGKITDLGALPGENDSTSTGLDINIHSQIVGSSEIEDGKPRAFLWEQGKLQDLNNLISPRSGWLLLVASRINDAGEILGRGYYRDGVHMFLMVPEVTSRDTSASGKVRR